MWVFAILAAMLLAFLGTVVTILAVIILTFDNLSRLSAFSLTLPNILSNCYMSLEKGERSSWISIVAFPKAVRDWGGLEFSFLGYELPALEHLLFWHG